MKWALISVICLSPLVAIAADDDWGGIFWGAGESDPDFQEKKKAKWLETDVETPTFPDFNKMLPLEVSTSSTSFKYFVDPKAFSLNTKDDITRYTIILESHSGVRNVFYEGIRCDINAYRVIATGTPDNQFQSTPKLSPWLKVQREGAMAYRWTLLDQYICDAKQSVAADEIADRIRYDNPVTNGIDENF